MVFAYLFKMSFLKNKLNHQLGFDTGHLEHSPDTGITNPERFVVVFLFCYFGGFFKIFKEKKKEIVTFLYDVHANLP